MGGAVLLVGSTSLVAGTVVSSVRPVFCVVRETGAVEKYYHEVGRSMLLAVVLEVADGLEIGILKHEDLCTHP